MSVTLIIEAALSTLGGIFAGVASYYWYRSTTVPIPAGLAGVSTTTGFGEAVVHVHAGPLVDPLLTASALNRRAALWSALAAATVALNAIPQVIDSLDKGHVVFW